MSNIIWGLDAKQNKLQHIRNETKEGIIRLPEYESYYEIQSIDPLTKDIATIWVRTTLANPPLLPTKRLFIEIEGRGYFILAVKNYDHTMYELRYELTVQEIEDAQNG